MIELKEKSMTSSTQGTVTGNGHVAGSHLKQNRRRRCKVAVLACLLLLLALLLVGVILAVTVFKVKEARTQVESVSLQGVAPRVSFPAIRVELNITLNLTLLVQNPNHASFKSGEGQGVLLYRGNTVGVTQLHPGLIRARATSDLLCLLTVEADRFMDSGLTSLLGDISSGELILQTKTRIPGRVSFLKIFRKHIVSTSDCEIVIGFPDLSIKSQDCKNHRKL